MRKNCVVVLISICVLMGCISTSPKDVIEVRPGVYVTNNVNALPLSTSGYDIYLVGEKHRQREVHLFFLEYLKMLHEANGLRDIVLEVGQYYEKEINEYVLGAGDMSSFGYSVTELLNGFRKLNETLPDNEKIRVHAVDIDYILTIETHLQKLKEEIGPQGEDIQITWCNSEEKMLALVDQLAEVTDRESILHELETVRASIRWVFEIGASIREEAITRNIQYVLRELDGAPILALYGVWHARKATRFAPESQPWAERLTESGVNIYLVFTSGISGFPAANINPDQIQFTDGTTLGDIFDSTPECDIVYVDLRLPANKTVTCSREELGSFYAFDPLVPLQEMFDGILLFREVTPLCPES